MFGGCSGGLITVCETAAFPPKTALVSCPAAGQGAETPSEEEKQTIGMAMGSGVSRHVNSGACWRSQPEMEIDERMDYQSIGCII